jgi:hypothetical protein
MVNRQNIKAIFLILIYLIGFNVELFHHHYYKESNDFQRLNQYSKEYDTDTIVPDSCNNCPICRVSQYNVYLPSIIELNHYYSESFDIIIDEIDVRSRLIIHSPQQRSPPDFGFINI